MKSVLKSALILGLTVAVTSCREEVNSIPPQVEPQPRELVVVSDAYMLGHNNGEWSRIKYKDVIFTRDISNWVPGEEVIYLPEIPEDFTDVNYGFYYPWQGEDSICYWYEGGLLWVNGKMVAGYYFDLMKLENKALENVLSVCIGYSDLPASLDDFSIPSFTITPEELTRFPKLSLLEIGIRDEMGYTHRVLDSIKSFPQDLLLYFNYYNPTNNNIKQLLDFPNLRWLTISEEISGKMTNAGLMQLRHANKLKRLTLCIDTTISRIKPKTIAKLRKKLPNCKINIQSPSVINVPPEKLSLREWFFQRVLSNPLLRQIYIALFT